MESSILKAEPKARGYKIFESDWTCRGKQYLCPGIFEEDGELAICKHGMHFCKELVDCFYYYDFTKDHHCAEVIARGDVITEGNKSCTNRLEIVREIPFEEVIKMVNVGEDNSGIGNTGDSNHGGFNTGSYNDGNENTGGRNFGCRNVGCSNIGNDNSGYGNMGDYNSGDNNVGYFNSGDCNAGNDNSGSWNVGDHHAGFFNTKPEPIVMFDKPVDEDVYLKWKERERTYVMDIMSSCPKYIEEVTYGSMTDEEKRKYPGAEFTKSYLKFRLDIAVIR